MALLVLDRVAKSFRGKLLWRDVSGDVPLQARIGLIGGPVSGKTTLLRVIAGRETPDRGRVLRQPGLRVGWPTAAGFRRSEASLTVREFCLEAFTDLQTLELELARLEEDLVDPHRAAELLPRYGPLQERFERNGGYSYQARMDEVLEGLEFGPGQARVSDLAAEGRMKARLARCLLEDPDLLLLDQPAQAMGPGPMLWLAGWLREWPGAWVCAAPAGSALEEEIECVWRLRPDGFHSRAGVREMTKAAGGFVMELRHEPDPPRSL
jgi:ATP-binding cassette subfamily F protein 3